MELKQYNMKKIIIGVGILFQACTAFAQPQLQKLWETDSVLPIPKAVLYDGVEKRLFVSCMDGAHDAKDGKGYVAVLGTDGGIQLPNWMNALHAPKGLVLFENIVFVADMNEVLIIDGKRALTLKRIKVEGAMNITDIAMTVDGFIFATDSRLGRIFKIEKDKSILYSEGLRGVSAITANQKDLFLLANGNLFQLTEKKDMNKIAGDLPLTAEGLVQIGKQEFLVSATEGKLLHIKDGKVTELLHTPGIPMGDIGYDAKRKIVYIPTLQHKTVVAYQLTNK